MLIDAYAHLDKYADDVLEWISEEIVVRRIPTVSKATTPASHQRGGTISGRCKLVTPERERRS